MTDPQINEKLNKQAPIGYRLNKIMPFSYPVRKVRMEVLIDKQPDGSMLKMYSVILRAIQVGLNNQTDLFNFLGLGETDDFILRELYFLREKGYLNLFSDSWIVTDSGQSFLNNNLIFREEEIGKFEFLIEGISGEVMSSYEHTTVTNALPIKVKEELYIETRNPKLIEGKFQDVSDLFKQEKENKSYLISYTTGEIERDDPEWLNFYLVEYVHEHDNGLDSNVEVREYNDSLKINKLLTSKFNSEYRIHYHQIAVNSMQTGNISNDDLK